MTEEAKYMYEAKKKPANADGAGGNAGSGGGVYNANVGGNGGYSGYEDEISLRELIEILLKEKFLIIGVTVLAIILAGVYTLGILKPTYESEAFLIVNAGESVATPYGEYKLPFTKVDEYIEVIKNPTALKRTANDLGDPNISYDKLKNTIKVEKEKDAKVFRVKAVTGSAQKSFDIVKTHTDNYISHLNMLMARTAVEQFHNSLTADQVSIERSLVKNADEMAASVELLAQTPKAIELENALISEADYALMMAGSGSVSLADIAGDKIINQELNPSYLQLLDKITNLEITRSNLVNKQTDNARLLADLANDRTAVEYYRETMIVPELSPGLAQSMNSLVVVVNRPDLNEQKTGPRNSLNMAIGAVLGLMLGVFAAFFRHYWMTSGEEK